MIEVTTPIERNINFMLFYRRSMLTIRTVDALLIRIE